MYEYIQMDDVGKIAISDAIIVRFAAEKCLEYKWTKAEWNICD